MKQLIIFIIILLKLSLNVMAQDNLAVLVNPSAKIEELKFSEVKSIFKGERQKWKDNSKVTIALMKTNTSTGALIAKRIYGMSGDQLNKYWLSLVFQGRATAPVFFESEEELKAFVQKTKGAIGILSGSAVGNEKPVTVDGERLF